MNIYDKVEIGCGKTKRTGFFGIDVALLPGVDLVADIDKEGIPLPDNSVGHMLFVHSLEHFSDFLFIVSEIWRTCRHKACVDIYAPYYTNMINLSNPYHKVHLTEYTFLFFTDKVKKVSTGYRLSRGSANEQNKICFRQEEVQFVYFEPWDSKSKEEQDFARLHYMHVVRDMYIRLRVIKS